MAENENSKLDIFLRQLKATQLVRWLFCDMNGNARSKLIPGSMSAFFVASQPRRFCTAVIPMSCNSDLPELAWVLDNGYPDCEMIPEPDSFHLASWSLSSHPASIGQVLCSTRWPDGGAPVEFDPRNVIRRQLERLDTELGLKLACWPELQWHLCNQQPGGDWDWPETASTDSSGLMHCHEALISDLCSAMANAGVNVDTVSTGSGAGQFCASLAPAIGAKAADGAFLGREIVKQVAANYGLTATFMPTPHATAGACLLRVNHALTLSGSNHSNFDFNQASLTSTPPALLRHWLAGLVHHSPGIAALVWPTLNCFRSSKPGRRVSWSCTGYAAEGAGGSSGLVDFRLAPMCTAADDQPSILGWRLENNLPSSAASAHIALAATVAAGIDGVLKKLELPTRPEDSPMLPSDMASAVAVLQVDSVISEALGAQLADFYIQARLQFDLSKVLAGAKPDETYAEGLKREAEFYLEFH